MESEKENNKKPETENNDEKNSQDDKFIQTPPKGTIWRQLTAGAWYTWTE